MKGDKNGKIRQMSIYDYIEDEEREKMKIEEPKRKEILLNYDLKQKKWK